LTGAPLEIKGYKRVLKLSDWLNSHDAALFPERRIQGFFHFLWLANGYPDRFFIFQESPAKSQFAGVD
jgi:hypothetical protein